MDQQKRLDKLEAQMGKVEAFLPTVELWLTVLAEQFKLTRNFVLSLEKKPEVAPTETPKEEPKAVEPETPKQ